MEESCKHEAETGKRENHRVESIFFVIDHKCGVWGLEETHRYSQDAQPYFPAFSSHPMAIMGETSRLLHKVVLAHQAVQLLS